METTKDASEVYIEVKEAINSSMVQYCDLINIDDLSESNQKVVQKLVPILRQICIDLLKSEIDSELNTNLDNDKDGALDNGYDNAYFNVDDNNKDDKDGNGNIENVEDIVDMDMGI